MTEKVIRVTKSSEQPVVHKRVLSTRDLLKKDGKVIRLRTLVRIFNGARQFWKRNRKVGREFADIYLVDEPGSKKGRISAGAMLIWEEAFQAMKVLRQAGFDAELIEKDSDCFLVTSIPGGFRHVQIYQMSINISFSGREKIEPVTRALFLATSKLPKKERGKAYKKKK